MTDRQMIVNARLNRLEHISPARTGHSVRKPVGLVLLQPYQVSAETRADGQSCWQYVSKQDLLQACAAIGYSYCHIHFGIRGNTLGAQVTRGFELYFLGSLQI